MGSKPVAVNNKYTCYPFKREDLSLYLFILFSDLWQHGKGEPNLDYGLAFLLLFVCIFVVVCICVSSVYPQNWVYMVAVVFLNSPSDYISVI